ncbi:MAG TPA: MgtC/SapB family protein [Planctomycetaceae bacterium]|nr:MgtC/SapB family protein [Planctomycetaceae bacterium]
MDDVNPLPLLQQLGVSLLLGLLVGLQRERTQQGPAGFRTFALISVFGTLCAVLGRQFEQPWVLPAGLLGVVALLVVSNLPRQADADGDYGVTTETAMLVMYIAGALLVFLPWIVPVAVAGGTAILLQFKPQLHGFAQRMGEADFRAILQFVLITFIVLPVLKEYDRAFDPLTPLHRVFPEADWPDFAVLNPYEIWWLVVLVVGISLGGYVCYKLLGERAGSVLGGILGGVISSTATTVSYARRTREADGLAGAAALVIMIASTVVYLRVLLEIAVVSPGFLKTAAGPVLAMFGFSVLLCLAMLTLAARNSGEMPQPGNPTEIKSALVFAGLYAVVLLAVAAAREFLPPEWLYAVAVVSGLTDMDAITLSSARLVQSGRLDPAVGWRMIVIATMSNLVFKAAIVAWLGHRRLLKWVAALFGLALLSGIAVLLLWPA